jgi:hypothetical protein
MPEVPVTLCHKQNERKVIRKMPRDIRDRPLFDRRKGTRREWREGGFRSRFGGGATLGYGTDKELHSLFLRIRRDVDFKGAFTPAEIDNRLREAAEGLRLLGRRGYVKPEKANRSAENLEKLAGTNFAPTVIATARRHPYGPENLTLNYGRKGAMEIILERDRRLRRMMRTRRED